MTLERRRFSRVKFLTGVDVSGEGKNFGGELLDISLNGALVAFEQSVPFAIGKLFDLHFFLPSSDVILEFEAKLVHSHGNHFGFKFISEALDTMSHLRRLLELNVGDHDRITNELSFLADATDPAVG